MEVLTVLKKNEVSGNKVFKQIESLCMHEHAKMI